MKLSDILAEWNYTISHLRSCYGGSNQILYDFIDLVTLFIALFTCKSYLYNIQVYTRLLLKRNNFWSLLKYNWLQ